MIVSHRHKFIFIKTDKSAGTSIEIALSKFCGSEDIIVPFEPEDEEIRRNLGYRGPQNYFIPKSSYSAKKWYRYLFKGEQTKYLTHISAEKIRRYIGGKAWNSYYKFCVVRNPWDRFISFYYWQYKTEPRPSISEVLESKKPLKLQRSGVNLYTIDGKVVVDKVCFYENLEADLEEVRLRCGLPEKLILPNAKASFRKDSRSYREILSKEQAEKISELLRQEIDLFGYEF